MANSTSSIQDFNGPVPGEWQMAKTIFKPLDFNGKWQICYLLFTVQDSNGPHPGEWQMAKMIFFMIIFFYMSSYL